MNGEPSLLHLFALVSQAMSGSATLKWGMSHRQPAAGLGRGWAALVYLYVCRETEGSAIPSALGSLI